MEKKKVLPRKAEGFKKKTKNKKKQMDISGENLVQLC